MTEPERPDRSQDTGNQIASPNADPLPAGAEPSKSDALWQGDDTRCRTVPRCVLDAGKRAKIVALVANGSSRRVAARFVGCSPSTITRTAQRDAEFGEALSRAEEHVEVEALQAIRAAAKKERYWRAAAWLLEHRNPRDYPSRAPGIFRVPEVVAMFVQVFTWVLPTAPDALRGLAMDKLKTLLVNVEASGEPDEQG